MAGFLRKKTKPDTPSKDLPPVTISSPASSSNPPPLFARFATTTQNTHAAASQRIVSSPMALTGRKESLKTGAGAASSPSLVAGSRDAEVRRRAQEQPPAGQASMGGAYYPYPSAMPPPVQAVPFRAAPVDKPLPSPIAAGSAPAPPVVRRATATRAQGPPPSASVPPHPHLRGAHSRASLDVRDLEKKPLPHPGAGPPPAPGYYWQEPSSPPPSPYTFTPKTPPKRSASAATPPAPAPQNGRMQPFPRAAYGQQGRSAPAAQGGYSASQGMHAGYSASEGALPPLPRPASRPDLPPPDTRNGVSNRMSVVGSRPAQDMRGTPASDRVLDLPPEFALFQEFSETLLDTSNGRPRHPPDPPPHSLKPTTEQVPGTQRSEFSDTLPDTSHGRPDPPPHTLKPTPEQVPGAPQQRPPQRLSVYRAPPGNTLHKPQPSLPPSSFEDDTPPRVPSPPLPPPPPPDDRKDEKANEMGVSTSHAAMAGILPLSYNDFPHASSMMHVSHSAYGPPPPSSTNNVVQQRPQQVLPPPPPARELPPSPPPLQSNRADARTTSPPRPPGAAPPLPAPTPPPPYPSANGGQPQHTLRAEKGGGQGLGLGQASGSGSGSAFQPAPPPPAQMLRKAPSVQAPAAPLRGKPRIFAAMVEAGGAEGAERPVDARWSYAQPQQPPQQQQQQQPQQQQPQMYHQPQPPPQPYYQQQLYQQQRPKPEQQGPYPALPVHRAPPHGSMNGHAPAHRPPPAQEYQPELLPAVEVFTTPKTHPDALPEFEFENAHGRGLMGDPRAARPLSPERTPTPPMQQQQQQQPKQQNPEGSTQSSPPRTKHGRSRSRSGGEGTRKLSKARPPNHRPEGSSASLRTLLTASANGSATTLPSTPESLVSKLLPNKASAKAPPQHPPTPLSTPPAQAVLEPELFGVGDAAGVGVGSAVIPLDEDPFARVEGVTLLKPATPPPPKEGSIKRPRAASRAASSLENGAEDATGPAQAESVEGQPEGPQKANGAVVPPTPVSPEDYRQWRKGHKSSQSSASAVAVPPPPPVPVVTRIARQNIFPVDAPPREPLTLTQFVADPQLLASLLAFLTFYDWCVLSSVSKEIRILFVRTPSLREAILESYLKTVGYTRWQWDDQEPLSISLQDLSDYMRGVSTPTHEYARVAAMHVHSLSIHPNHRDPSLVETVRALTSSTRAYSRVILRLRAQAEKEASVHSAAQSQAPPPPSYGTLPGKANGNFSPSRPGTASRVSSRAPSPTTSMYSYSQHGNGHPPTTLYQSASQTSLTFRSPLFRLRRAPLLRVFVPSPEGDWLSDKSVLECEAECRRAGITSLMRLGDVVWDVAVGDEGNVGRLVWDGSYLIDLDYTYSTIGDLPKYLPTLAFPPSYFHRVIRTGAQTTNPIMHIDISPWGEEIALNLQLLQDRVRTETPQGAYHNVVRWVHRSSFTIRPSRGLPRHSTAPRGSPANGRIPIPESNNLFVDSGWYGTIVVETEGTNEALADLQDRCGPGAFPPRMKGSNPRVTQAQVENRKVFRILRERSRPGEIWIKAVGIKERLL